MAIRSRRGKLYPAINFEAASVLGLDQVEWDRIVERLGREPNHFEATIFGALWSDRVSFKNSSALIEAANLYTEGLSKLPGSTLRLLQIKSASSGESTNPETIPEEVIEIVLRTSQQNKLSEIEASLGARGCLDTALLELTAAGAKPLAALALGRFGSHELLNQQRRFKKLVEGLGTFSNTFGLPILGGDFYFHPSFQKAPLINTAVLGIVHKKKKDKMVLPFESPVLLVGAKTGLDHAYGKIPGGKSPKSSIPMGDPLLASKLINASQEILGSQAAEEIIVVGPGGLAVACFNLATRINRPVLLDIDRVPLRQENLDPLEIILSESADRLLMVTTPEKHRALNNILYKWDLHSIRVGEVNDADGIEFYWNHYQAADIPFHFVSSGVVAKTMNVVQFPPMLKRSDRSGADDTNKLRKRVDQDEWTLVREASLRTDAKNLEKQIPIPSNLEDTWLDLLANPNLSSKQPVFANFDQLIGGRTLARAGQDSAPLRIINSGSNSNLEFSSVAITMSANSLYVSMEPYLGTVQSVAEVMRNLSSTGATPLGIAICMNFGHPDRYREVCDLAESIRGLGDSSRIWKLPILSEEVALENGTDGCPMMPTPVIVGVGGIPKGKKPCPSFFQEKGDIIILLGETKNEIGCSEYSNYVHKRVNTLVPDIDFAREEQRCQTIRELINLDLLKSCHDLARGGFGISLVESCLMREKPIGASFEFSQKIVPSEQNAELRKDSALFAETSGRYLISFSEENSEKVQKYISERKIPISGYGVVGGKNISVSGVVNVELHLSTTYRIWMHRLESYLHTANKDQMMAA